MHFPDSNKITKAQVINILLHCAALCLKSEHPDIVAQAAGLYDLASRVNSGAASLAEGRWVVDQLRFQAKHTLQVLAINDASNRDESEFEIPPRIGDYGD